MYGKIPWVTSEELVISVALKIEDWLRKGIKLQRDQTDVKVFAVLAREWIVDSNWNWRMARVIARTWAIQALLYKELE